ncbi:unnamed protein product [Lactuca saligna]|uniref:Uncharacterized protein n=1 Tax=Lactuca saligna TaxID=75948 RepID=A0AA35UYW2_LACSI|nr:unnamed protein product [Lactuca saligna]
MDDQSYNIISTTLAQEEYKTLKNILEEAKSADLSLEDNMALMIGSIHKRITIHKQNEEENLAVACVAVSEDPITGSWSSWPRTTIVHTIPMASGGSWSWGIVVGTMNANGKFD